ncbi:hypothetical protein EVAR_5093_1 [Eumeta japonica]|uniref:Uncharacterized protein n=1 Tax=Eumeta variegata TaxID=151549 RepID=A0A4C1SV09_EUMVA|nr:hypothetical protein EVAR_5093_1 [Eumeta japonica]
MTDVAFGRIRDVACARANSTALVYNRYPLVFTDLIKKSNGLRSGHFDVKVEPRSGRPVTDKVDATLGESRARCGSKKLKDTSCKVSRNPVFNLSRVKNSSDSTDADGCAHNGQKCEPRAAMLRWATAEPRVCVRARVTICQSLTMEHDRDKTNNILRKNDVVVNTFRCQYLPSGLKECSKPKYRVSVAYSPLQVASKALVIL